jgi:hypothetical protein
MTNRHWTSGWVSAVFRDYGPEAWDDDELAVRRDAAFVVVDSDALERQCALVRGLGVTTSAPRWAVDEVSCHADGASPEAIRAVMRDPAALCELHLNAWISTGAWAEVVRRYRSERPIRSVPSRREAAAVADAAEISDRPEWAEAVRRYRSIPPERAAAATDEVKHEIVLGVHGSRAEIRGTIELWRTRDGSLSDSAWWLKIRFPASTAEPDADRHKHIMAGYRDRSVLVEYPGLHNVQRQKVLLQMNHRGDLISDCYAL